jgi:hypothetical protein
MSVFIHLTGIMGSIMIHGGKSSGMSRTGALSGIRVHTGDIPTIITGDIPFIMIPIITDGIIRPMPHGVIMAVPAVTI